MYGIIRAEKRKREDITKQLQQHNQREAKFYKSNPDIDITKLDEDITLIHCEHFRNKVDELIKEYDIKRVRSDSVLMLDGVLTASPEFFQGKTKDEMNDYFRKGLPIIEKEFGKIISATIHYDEKTPHLHFATVPIIEEANGNKLSAKRLLGGRKELSEKQDRIYNEFFKGYGFDRGRISNRENGFVQHIEQSRFKAAEAKKQLSEVQSKLNSTSEQLERATDYLQDSKDKSNDLCAKIIQSEEKLKNINKLLEERYESYNIIESDISAIRNTFSEMMQDLASIASSSDIAERTLQSAIFNGCSTNEQIERLQQELQDSRDAVEILDDMEQFKDFFNDDLSR